MILYDGKQVSPEAALNILLCYKYRQLETIRPLSIDGKMLNVKVIINSIK